MKRKGATVDDGRQS